LFEGIVMQNADKRKVASTLDEGTGYIMNKDSKSQTPKEMWGRIRAATLKRKGP
jgi:uncharacterized membrane-anchored protein